jgi:manganese/iron transport system permease protein
VLAAIRFLTEPFEPAYMQRALLVAVIIAVLAGVVGVVVQLRQLSFMTDALTHTVFPGIAIAFVLDQSIFAGALVAGALSAALLTFAARSSRIDHDAFMALVLASLFSIGVIFVSRNRTYTADLTSLLFGRVLAVEATQIVETLVVALLALGILVAIRKELLLRAFDPTGAEAMGYSLLRIDLVVNLVVALVVVAAVRAVGTALVVAFLITPAATARLVCRRLGPLIATSVLVGLVGAWAGLAISYDASVHSGVRLAAGATIVVVLTALFALVALAAAIQRVRRRRRALRRGDGRVPQPAHHCEVPA